MLMSRTDFRAFGVVDFPPKSGPGFVYVLCWVSGEDEIPFYVGETQSIWGRLNDYYWADFQASTDFRAGEVIRYLNTRSIRVVARYRVSTERRSEERAIIKELRAEGRLLLNNLPAYDYQTSHEDRHRAEVQEQVDRIIEATALNRSTRD